MRVSLGIKNNNPLNIRYTALNKWKGLVGSEKGFCVFDTMEYGLRAGIITLRTYIKKHHLTSVEAIIKRFAPSSENNTSAYISYVSGVLCAARCNPDIIFYKSDSFNLMVAAMCTYESWYRCSANDIKNIINKFNL